MGKLTLPPAHQEWADKRIAEDGHADLAAYIGYLILCDRDRETVKRMEQCKSPQS